MSYIVQANIAKSCLGIFEQDKRLLFFPFLSLVTILSMLIGIPLLIIYFSFGGLDKIATVRFLDQLAQYNLYLILILFLIVYLAYLIISFFNAAQTFCVYQLIKEGKMEIVTGFYYAAKNGYAILFWATIDTTVGFVLGIVQDKTKGTVTKIASILLEFSWHLFTYFVIPLLVIKKSDTISAIKESGRIFKETWGENVVANIRLFIFFLPYYLIAVGILLSPIYLRIEYYVTSLLLTVIGCFLLLAIVLISSSIQVILKTVLFLYAEEGKIANGFLRDSLDSMFVIKNKKS